MKKSYLFTGIFAMITSLAFAQTAPSHEKYVDYSSKTEWSTAYSALSEAEIGSKALYQGYDATAAENEEFFISRVKPRKRFSFTGTQVKESMSPERKFLWWCPIGSEGWNALPTYWFGGEVSPGLPLPEASFPRHDTPAAVFEMTSLRCQDRSH